MERVELPTVEERFQLSHIGLVVVPDFSVPSGRWKNFSETVVVIKPDGREFEATAQFNMSHFNIPDPNVSVDKRWRVVVSLPDGKKDEVPIGSKILVRGRLEMPYSPAMRPNRAFESGAPLNANVRLLFDARC